jgi:hypothetical protein
VVHAGAYKTGSTAIQQHLAKLSRFGPYRYPLSDGDVSHFRLATALGFYRDAFASTRFGDKEYLLKFKEMLGTEGDVVLSCEHFSDLSDPNSVSRLAKFLKICGFERIVVVLLVRKPSEYLDSFYREVIKWGSIQARNAFFCELMQKPMMFDVADLYGRCLGSDNVLVEAYDGRDVLGQFCRMLGVGRAGKPGPEDRTNASLDPVTSELLRRVNLCVGDVGVRRMIFETFQELMDRGLVISAAAGSNIGAEPLEPEVASQLAALDAAYEARLADLVTAATPILDVATA